MSPSTEHPQAIPSDPALRRLTKSLAMIDALLMPDPSFRYYRYDSQWNWGEEMASMDNGSGDEWFLLFARCGAALKGFAHEMRAARDSFSPQLIQEAVPAEFSSFLREPAFCLEDTTSCLWRGQMDAGWNVVVPVGSQLPASADGSAEMLGIFDGDPQTYQAWSEEYYEREVPLAVVRALYEHRLLEADLLAELNPELRWADIRIDARQIGYPDASGV